MRQISGTGNQSGFTLLELLLAVTLGAVVLSAVYGSFSTAIDANRRISHAATELQAWRYFSERLRSDLHNLMASELASSASVNGTGNTLTVKYQPRRGAAESILYEQRRNTGGGQIRRTRIALSGRDDADREEAGSIVYENVETLSFRYLTDGQWRSNTGESMPTALECVVVADGRQRAVIIALESEPLKS